LEAAAKLQDAYQSTLANLHGEDAVLHPLQLVMLSGTLVRDAIYDRVPSARQIVEEANKGLRAGSNNPFAIWALEEEQLTAIHEGITAAQTTRSLDNVEHAVKKSMQTIGPVLAAQATASPKDAKIRELHQLREAEKKLIELTKMSLRDSSVRRNFEKAMQEWRIGLQSVYISGFHRQGLGSDDPTERILTNMIAMSIETISTMQLALRNLSVDKMFLSLRDRKLPYAQDEVRMLQNTNNELLRMLETLRKCKADQSRKEGRKQGPLSQPTGPMGLFGL
jgi:hypothetical protein